MGFRGGFLLCFNIKIYWVSDGLDVLEPRYRTLDCSLHHRYFDTSENHNSELDLSVNSSEIYGKSSAIGPGPIQNGDFHLYLP
jgi:hypothetical protein